MRDDRRTRRRDFFSAGLYGIAGAIGGIAGRAMASAADEPSWEYRVTPQAVDDGPDTTDDIHAVAREYLARKASGRKPRIERRAVGPWERHEPAEQVAAELASKVH